MSPLSRPNTKYSVGSKAPTVLDCTPGRADRSPRPDLPLRRHEPPRSILSTQSSRRADHVKRAAPSKPSTTPSSGARSPAREAVPHARGRSRGVRALPTQGPVTNCLSLLFQVAQGVASSRGEGRTQAKCEEAENQRVERSAISDQHRTTLLVSSKTTGKSLPECKGPTRYSRTRCADTLELHRQIAMARILEIQP
jgi:hypothetical protein